MKNFSHDHPRVVAATPALSPALRRAAYPAGITESQLARFEHDAGVTATPPAAKPSVATDAAPAPAAHRTPPGAVRAGGGGGAPIATTTPTPAPVSSKPSPAANPLLAAVSGAMAEFNSFHSSNREPDNA